MAVKREPVVKPVPILSLKPTQLTVGIREVKEKRKLWREHKPKKRAEVLGRHMIPVVLGPGDRHYVIDHHHLARALHDEGVKDVLVTVVADLTHGRSAVVLGRDGQPPLGLSLRRQGRAPALSRTFRRAIVDLKDDPFRSLAGELRRAGGFAKDTTPFSEFLWADFLRRGFAQERRDQFRQGDRERALSLGQGKDAIYLPGWCGPSSDD